MSQQRIEQQQILNRLKTAPGVLVDTAEGKRWNLVEALRFVNSQTLIAAGFKPEAVTRARLAARRRAMVDSIHTSSTTSAADKSKLDDLGITEADLMFPLDIDEVEEVPLIDDLHLPTGELSGRDMFPVQRQFREERPVSRRRIPRRRVGR